MESLPDRLPLVIGVTGHRDLRDEDVPRLEREIAGIIARLRRDYLDAETPIVVLSALAEGADRLVARVALAHGAYLIAPLPLPLEEYRCDFEPGLKPGNVAEFDALLARAIAAPVMPLRAASLEALRADRGERAEQYRAVGIFITQHCHVLLALWDGDGKDMAAGGTAEVVAFKRDGIPLMVGGSPRASLDASEVGPVIEIATPRMKERNAAKEVAVGRWGRDLVKRHRGGIVRRSWRRAAAFLARTLHREAKDERATLPVAVRRELDAWQSFETLIDLTRTFNREATALAASADGAARRAHGLDALFTDPAGVTDLEAKASAMKRAPLWCRLYAVADALAQERQKQFQWDWRLLFFFGFVAFFCFAMFTHAGYVTNLFLGGYFVTFLVLLVLFARATLGQHQERYLDYRALAEALRVAVYWKLIGIGARRADAKAGDGRAATVDAGPVGDVAAAYPIKQSNELAWVKICLRTIERLDRPDDAPPGRIDPRGHALARRFWVHGQFAYFKRQGFRHDSLAGTIETHSAILLVLSPFVFVPLLFFHVLRDWPELEEMVLIVVGLLPGIAAAWAGYAERLAFKAQARQYDRMRALFERAYDLLPQAIDEETAAHARALYLELGTEAMRENAEWVAIYRQRPIQPPQ